MDRRDFMKAAVGVGVGLMLRPFSGIAGPFATVNAAETIAARPHMVAVRNGEPAAMFDRGIAAMGGMGRFVDRGQTVVLKPNASFDTARNWRATPIRRWSNGSSNTASKRARHG